MIGGCCQVRILSFHCSFRTKLTMTIGFLVSLAISLQSNWCFVWCFQHLMFHCPCPNPQLHRQVSVSWYSLFDCIIGWFLVSAIFSMYQPHLLIFHATWEARPSWPMLTLICGLGDGPGMVGSPSRWAEAFKNCWRSWKNTWVLRASSFWTCRSQKYFHGTLSMKWSPIRSYSDQRIPPRSHDRKTCFFGILSWDFLSGRG